MIKKYNEYYNSLKYYTGKEVAEYIKDITPDEDVIPDYFIRKYVLPNNEWELKNIYLNDLLKSDESFLEYFNSKEDRYYGYDMVQEELNFPLVIYKGIVIDGYSRASKLIRMGDDIAKAYVII